MKSNVVEIPVSQICESLGYSYNKIRFVSRDIKKELMNMVSNSFVRLKDPYSTRFYAGNLLINVYGNSDVINITINPDFLPHFESLYATKSFITMIGPSSAKFSSSYAMPLYMWFKLFHGSDNEKNTHTFTTKDLKDIFNLPPEAYMTVRKITKNTEFLNSVKKHREETVKDVPVVGFEYFKEMEQIYNDEVIEELEKMGARFDRYGFEKKTLETALKEINAKTEDVRIIPTDDGKLYKKVKDERTGKVAGYTIQYKILDENTIKKNRQILIEHEKTKEA